MRIFDGKSAGLRHWSASVFFNLFVILPWATLTHRLVLLWPVLTAILVIQITVVGTMFIRLHKLYYPSLVLDRRMRLFMMVLVPPALIRAVDYVSLGLIAKHHPLAAANVLSDRPSFMRFARALLLDLRFPKLPICPGNSYAEVETERWSGKHFENTLRRSWRLEGLRWLRLQGLLRGTMRSACLTAPVVTSSSS